MLFAFVIFHLVRVFRPVLETCLVPHLTSKFPSLLYPTHSSDLNRVDATMCTACDYKERGMMPRALMPSKAVVGPSMPSKTQPLGRGMQPLNTRSTLVLIHVAANIFTLSNVHCSARCKPVGFRILMSYIRNFRYPCQRAILSLLVATVG